MYVSQLFEMQGHTVHIIIFFLFSQVPYEKLMLQRFQQFHLES
jgi:hypothetical protein